ncbi:23S rRNA (pseudouridine(1915)-N(3))-methyltransferase RlmH [Amygdalobacter nucleatus]|uniref:Ribosomal RNA large subunit methyltransferase H n=1 Tax=Amygdalobacter nucleatus TaxID=3029274 RepID=A0A133YEE3_9FIRM|nr:23S rRNA (pseudouridine(1915)-N(3))-methyltransferase RlmH [Amygdalobacter nucleatus]KXB41582.1 putative rRNA large subunit m3Psi methyltransferase RlmH [Amygdalobacter nucleatus]MDF0485580.1 23S rRNA (pseudouridine(1915)-N(3))-methyltransferase RlmH [Amygdalobacter nucleatus]
MQVQIVAVGSVKEKYILTGISDFQKRLRRFCNLSIVEITAQPDQMEARRALKIEADLIRQKWLTKAYKVALTPHGKELSSEELAAKLPKWLEQGNSELTLIIGSSRGLAADIIKECQATWAFGPLTLTHGVARFIAIEQIYRAYKINANEAYHK